MSADPATLEICPQCGRTSTIVLGRCPECGFVREARGVPPQRDHREGFEFWDTIDFLVATRFGIVAIFLVAVSAIVLLVDLLNRIG